MGDGSIGELKLQIEAEASNANDAIAELRASLESLKESLDLSGLGTLSKQMEGLAKSAQSVSRAFKKISDLNDKLSSTMTGASESLSPMGTEELDSSVNQMTADLDSASGSVSAFTSGIGSLSDMMGGELPSDISVAASGMGSLETAVDSASTEIMVISQQLPAVVGNMSTALANAGVNFEMVFTQLPAVISTVNAAMESFSQRVIYATGEARLLLPVFDDIGVGARNFASEMGISLSEAESKLHQFDSSASEVGMDVESIMGSMPSYFSILGSVVDGVEQSMVTAFNGIREAMTGLAGAASIVATGVSSAFTTVTSAVSSAASAISSTISTITSGLSRVTSIASTVASAIWAIPGAINSAAQSFISLGEGAAHAVTELAGLPSLMETVGSASDWLGSKIRKLTNLFAMMGFRKLFTAAFKEMGNAMNQLAAESDSFAAHLNSLQAACSNLSHATAAVSIPLLDIFGPALEYIINLLATAVTLINQFLSALTGKSYYTTAAKGISGVGSAIGSAGKAAKQAEQDFTGAMDELNIINENDSGGGGDGGGGGGGGAGGYYEDLAIDPRILDLVEQLKEAWANADFTEIGGMVGAALRDALNSIDWAPIQEFAWRLARSLATFFNGFVETEGLAESIGNTIGEMINTALIFASTFLETFHWDSLGQFIGEGLNAVVATVDWEMFGRTLADMILARLETVANAIATFDWAAAGQALATAVNSLVETLQTGVEKIGEEVGWDNLGSKVADGLNTLVNDIHWTEIGETLGTLFNAAVSAIGAFLEDVKWEDMGSRLMLGLNTLIGTVEWSSLGETIGAKFNAAIEFIKGAVETFDWPGTASALAEGVNSLIEKVEWGDLGQAIDTAFKGALEFLSVALTEIDWYQLGQDVLECLTNIDWVSICNSFFEVFGEAFGAIGEFLRGLIGEAMGKIGSYFDEYIQEAVDAGGSVVSGILLGIADGLLDIGSWIKANVFDPFINGFKSIFGIGSPSTVMAEQGGYVIEGLLQGITENFSGITEFFSTALEDVIGILGEAWDTISGAAGEAWEGITGVVSGAWEGISSTASTIWGGITSTISGVWDDLTGKSKDTTDEIEEDFTTSFETIDTETSNSWGNIESTFSSSCSTVTGDVKSAWNTMEGDFSSGFNTVTGDTTRSWTAIKSDFTSGCNSVTSDTSTSLSTIETDWDTSMSAVERNTESGWQDIKEDFTEGWETVSTNTNDSWEAIKTTFTESWASVITETETSFTTLETDWTTAMNNINTGATTGWESLKTTFTTGVDAIQHAITDVNWQNLGEEIVNGLEKGWDAKWPALKTKILNEVKDLVKEVNQALDIGSPSGVFEDIGKYTVEGFEKGFDEEADNAYYDVDQWVSRISGVSPMMGVGVDTSLIDSFVPNLDMGGTVNDALQNAINAQGSITAALSGGADFRDIVIEAIQEALNQNSLVSSIEDSVKRQADKSDTTQINISGRELARVVKRQNQANGYSFSSTT